MVLFKSLIAFDLETTSLPEHDHNTTKITELSFIGCEVEHLRNSEGLPRVLHKLVLAFNPLKLIQPEASRVSGLTNELLMNVQPLREEDLDTLKQFISRLPSPVCIVAHNGDNFDFPILRRAIEKLHQKLPNNVYCADSIKAFHSLVPKVEHPSWTRRSKTKISEEITPEKQNTEVLNSIPHKNVCRTLFKEDDALSDWVSIQEGQSLLVTQSSSCIPRSYKLSDMYYYYFGRYFKDCHRAEEDTKALLGCIKKCKGFLDWMNENAVIFNSIQPLF